MGFFILDGFWGYSEMGFVVVVFMVDGFWGVFMLDSGMGWGLHARWVLGLVLGWVLGLVLGWVSSALLWNDSLGFYFRD